MPLTSQYSHLKRQTLESFLDFSKGGASPQWPVEVFLEISNICDLKCAMCPTFSALSTHRLSNIQRNDRGLMSIDKDIIQLDEILKHALRVHAFGYGEPTVHPQFQEIVETLAGYEVVVDFFSHGMHFTETVCQFLVDSGIVRVTISFSGANKKDYENVYLGGKFEQVLAGIKRLADCKSRSGKSFPEIEINSLGFHHHIETLPEFIQLMSDHGANTINVKPLHINSLPELRGHKSFMHPAEKQKIEEAKYLARKLGIHLASKPYELSETAAIGFDKAMAEMDPADLHARIEQQQQEFIPIDDFKTIARSEQKKSDARQQLKQFESSNQKPSQKIQMNNWFQNQGTPCLEPFKTFYSNYDGKAYTCCFRRSKDYIGHLSEQNGVDIWNSQEYQTLRQRATNNQYLDEMCKNCINKNAYPRDHGIKQTFNFYSRWYTERFGEAFLPDLQQRVQTMPDNQTILNNHKS